MYESHFGLITKPFQLRPDPDFFYSSAGHKRALAYLQYGLTQGEGFIVVTGNIGTGKTTLMRSLLEGISYDNIVAGQLVTTKLEADDLLRMICSAFGLPVDGKPKAVLLQQFEAYLHEVNQLGKRVLLIVDEAQNLPASAIEELRMLSNFQTSDGPMFQSFLLGQPELRSIIQAPSMEQFRQRIIASCHLQPLKPEEIKEYIIWRLTIAGWAKNPRFQESTFNAIYQHTDGVPRRINIFCDRLLLFCFLEELALITEQTVATVAEELACEMHGAEEPRPDPLRGSQQQNPQPPAPLAELDNLRSKLAYIDDVLAQSIDDKLELLKALDAKMKMRINLVVNDGNKPR